MVPTMWVPNGIDKDVYSFSDIETDWLEEHGIHGKRLYIYAGIIGHAQGLDVIVKAKHG